MSDRLREVYSKIADDYLSKKRDTWQNFKEFKSKIGWSTKGIILDIGAGNGRNLHEMHGTLLVALDLSHKLLLGYVGPSSGERIAGALPKLPFRKSIADNALSLAVIHHFQDSEMVISALKEMKRVSQDTNLILSVWRRWRKNYAFKLVDAIRKGEDLDPLINHHRPWYNSNGEKLGTRFYHYYSYKELYYQVNDAGLKILEREYIGGKNNDANIFVLLVDAVD